MHNDPVSLNILKSLGCANQEKLAKEMMAAPASNHFKTHTT
jgi:hypothetical protein